ncbi:LRR receptor kinase SERK2 [Vitis vinifera]|uniref:LRR receptor kinase SERK2 n=1 Tax=Vitis vinifera TaxID=29760 RepID=A0A438DR50_VITVI|nr:LRR receptor kinase SERK2 [Vitis vinifera]
MDSGLDNQGLRGFLPNDISQLRHLQSINLSGNRIHGVIPPSLGSIAGLEILDLSYNSFNGSIPESLGLLTSLRKLSLNGNSLSGRVPSALGGRLLHRASFKCVTTSLGLQNIYLVFVVYRGYVHAVPTSPLDAKIGIALGGCVALLVLVICSICWCKRRENILRAQRISAAREAPYAKARTHFARDVQMGRFHGHDNARTAAENGPSLLS